MSTNNRIPVQSLDLETKNIILLYFPKESPINDCRNFDLFASRVVHLSDQHGFFTYPDSDFQKLKKQLIENEPEVAAKNIHMSIAYIYKFHFICMPVLEGYVNPDITSINIYHRWDRFKQELLMFKDSLKPKTYHGHNKC